MSAPGSVTVWIEKLKAGDPAGAEQLWQGYFRRLVGLARGRLGGLPRAAADEEDVALSAFGSFFQAVEKGRFPRLDDRDDLWQVLVMLTARKANRLVRKAGTKKRGGGAVRNASALTGDEEAELAEVIGREPTPEFAAQVADELRRLLDKLGDDELRAVAVAKMEGYSRAEIADRLGASERAVTRRVRVIRALLKDEEGVA
jgi:DNA-directed RNA polymerase specialized sigma24 family protein